MGKKKHTGTASLKPPVRRGLRSDDANHTDTSCARRSRLLLPVLLAATLAAYYPAWHGAVLWDDDQHITREDLSSLSGLARIWSDFGATQQYYPLTHSTFWIQHKLWEDETLGYHLVNIIFHAFSAYLLALILWRLSVPGAVLTAVIFALHPVQVESVAWITELKNVLSGLLYLSSAAVFLRFHRTRQKTWYLLGTVLFVMALLAKTVTATLPPALLVIIWWQRGKLEWRRDVLPIAPWFILGTAGGLLTAWIEHTVIGAEGAGYQFSLIERCLIAGRVVWFYLGKLAWPTDLTFIYPRWQIDSGAWWQYIYPIGLVVCMAGLWCMRKVSRAPFAAMLLFCGTLFPVLGFFNVYPFRYSFVADHFQYLACIPIMALFSAGLVTLVKRLPLQSKTASIVLVSTIGCVLAVTTWSQSRQYIDAETLYRSTIARNPSCWMAHNNLGNALQKTGQLEESVTEYNEAVRIKPDYAEAYLNLGNTLQRMGRLEESLTQFQAALRLQPDFAEAYSNLGNALLGLGRTGDAILQFQEALRRKPDSAAIRFNLANAFQEVGRLEDAMVQYREALRLQPGFAGAHYNFGIVLQKLGRHQEAVGQFREAVKYVPGFAEAHNTLGISLAALGQLEEAVSHFKEAVRLKPGFGDAGANLARTLSMLKKEDLK